MAAASSWVGPYHGSMQDTAQGSRTFSSWDSLSSQSSSGVDPALDSDNAPGC